MNLAKAQNLKLVLDSTFYMLGLDRHMELLLDKMEHGGEDIGQLLLKF